MKVKRSVLYKGNDILKTKFRKYNNEPIIFVERKFNLIDANLANDVRRKCLDDSFYSLIADAINSQMDAIFFLVWAFPLDAYHFGKDLRFVLLLCFISEVLWSLTEQLLLSARAGQ